MDHGPPRSGRRRTGSLLLDLPGTVDGSAGRLDPAHPGGILPEELHGHERFRLRRRRSRHLPLAPGRRPGNRASGARPPAGKPAGGKESGREQGHDIPGQGVQRACGVGGRRFAGNLHHLHPCLQGRLLQRPAPLCGPARMRGRRDARKRAGRLRTGLVRLGL